MLTSTELKAIRAVMCRMAEDGRSAEQVETAMKILLDRFAALKVAQAKPTASTK